MAATLSDLGLGALELWGSDMVDSFSECRNLNHGILVYRYI